MSSQQSLFIDRLTIQPFLGFDDLKDVHGNSIQRWVLPSGRTTIIEDALIGVPLETDDVNRRIPSSPIMQLPADVLRYLLPSRYCDSDKLQDFSSAQFGYIANGLDRVIAISNWVHHNIRYVTGSGRFDISASEIAARGYGVCRDFAHVAIALCRAVNIPARYVTGHLPDIGVWDPGSPMDFHAYFEAYLDGGWCVFDSRFNVPRMGRVKIAHGLDAADCPFSMTFGDARLASIRVWAYQLDPATASVDSPVDLSQRLDGTPYLRMV